ncbi:M20 family metallopeptidase [Paenibacillus chondroitinus]|uniref:Peptidase M20 domain-containing protein 2 n=1 Tax=Paenibacillus chondroitinus TaxID=59842 RepID=A0ABU6DE61_9BACL|nr:MULTISPECIES: M20 family metallopeptidase [Paenibacillus]MCY9657307.1 M20 family metallopeptidase [Paenibacillus anseongense]MEB4795954.1 M20 family metallopeptidase [Paenibacillus chondroitinus]
MIQENLDASKSKQQIEQAVDSLDEQLRRISKQIHANPELSFHEHKAKKWLVEPLLEAGFEVEQGIAGLETSFRATWEGQPGGPTIALLAEYDALPAIGHACGHNLIGTASVGAALALKEAHPDLPGKIVVLGTPAEEEGGGKIIMCNEGIFDDIDAVMMVHPQNKTMVLRGALACVDATFTFHGKQAHASSSPEKGISALDALINAFVAINAIRQFVKEDVRIHGIITKGGDAPNVVPELCEAVFILRASTVEELEIVRKKVYRAVRSSAEGVGATVDITEGLIYAERNNNKALAQLFQNNLEQMGIEVSAPPQKGGVGSSDIGNVSQMTPTIHPYIRLGDATTHTPEFAQLAGSEEGMIELNRAAKALALTTYDLCTDKAAMQRVRNEFTAWKQNREGGTGIE